ncbi:hypothetical protein [Streptacidiphilus sp. EB129]|uniref:hypothetical protein n=1 Tax=Streptacidiphilus sp. EB129 TaxID=3156262 RepID=UPI003512E3AB
MVDSANIQVEVDTLTAFRDRVDGLLSSLDAGPASTKQISGQQLESAHLGSGFGEITDLVGTYQQVHQQLQSLSQTLSDQINAMSITIKVSEVGYQNVEADQVSTLWDIQGRTQANALPPGQGYVTVQQQLDAARQNQGSQSTDTQPTGDQTARPGPSPVARPY